MTTRLSADLSAYRRYTILTPVEVDQDGGLVYALRIAPEPTGESSRTKEWPEWLDGLFGLICIVLLAAWFWLVIAGARLAMRAVGG